MIDGRLLNENNLLDWHSIIGYVAQEGFLSDKTITDNIAFGIDNKKIDLLKVKESAKLAKINEFIENGIITVKAKNQQLEFNQEIKKQKQASRPKKSPKETEPSEE